MGSVLSLAAAVAALVLQSSAAAAALQKSNVVPVQSYEPEANWVVDFDDQRCFASRKFRSTAEPLTLGISAWAMFDWAKLVIEKPGDADGIVPLSGKVSIDGGKPHGVVMFAGDSANEGRVLYTFKLPGAALEELKSGKRVRVQSRQLNADIPLASLAPAISKLNECIPLLLEHWGHSREMQAAQSSYPSLRGLSFRVTDYPGSAIRRGAVGVVEVLLKVGVDGKPLNCKVIRSSGHNDLDSRTCEIVLKRGRFSPARDRNGQSMASPYFFSVNWLMP
jgi:TonB family protein